ncbi:MAG: PIG-L family deacetylase [Deltaproteobacteria bacterium]|nr:PIG-L family deacetylase [Deltaproteobacteria bacterium]
MSRSLKGQRNLNLDAAHVFVVPHPDDWQLSMGDYAFDLIDSEKTEVLMIIVDAGDAGRSNSYWQSREKGSLASVRSVLKTPIFTGGADEVVDSLEMGTKQLTRYTLRNVRMVFLRLPDGLVQGGGTEIGNFESIYKLYKDQIPSITSVDHVNTFTLGELKETLGGIVAGTFQDKTKPIRFYIQDPGPESHFSHSDHFATQAVARDVISGLGYRFCQTLAFEDYRTAKKTENITDNRQNNKTRLIEAYDLVVLTEHGECNLCFVNHYKWLTRSYHREFDC